MEPSVEAILLQNAVSVFSLFIALSNLPVGSFSSVSWVDSKANLKNLFSG